MKLYQSLKNNYILFAILFVASVLRFYKIDFQSPWLDEIYTLIEANPEHSVKEVYQAILKSEQQPPLYFVIINWMFRLFGYSSFVLRMFSAIMGILGVLGIYFLTKELANKKTGLLAALFLTVNYFHIQYSQEGRMYTLLFSATVFCFYYFVRFLKNPTARGAFFYMLSSTLMIYCHYFGLFVFVSQYLIFLFFIIKPQKVSRGRFFLYCLFSGITSLILYIPAFEALIRASNLKGSGGWIPVPGTDVYTQLIKEFFGQSEIVVFFVVVLILTFINRVIKEKENETFVFDSNEGNLTFAFYVLMSWICVTLLIPLVRSHLVRPMIVSRYLIEILPAIIILVSMGLFYVQNKTVRYVILTIIVVFSLTDIFVVKDYYSKINKSQFREVSDFIIKKNTTNEPVVSSMAFFYNYFFSNKKTDINLIEKPLEEYVTEMMNDSTKIKPFWYADAHGRTLNLTGNAQKFIDDNFVLRDKNMYNAWTHYYALISREIKEKDISKYLPLKDRNGDDFRCYIDNFEITPKAIKIKGWACFFDQDATDSNIEIILVANDKAFEIQHREVDRNDVAEYYHIPYDLTNCGFRVNSLTAGLPPGSYRLGIILKNKITNKEGLVLCSNSFVKD